MIQTIKKLWTSALKSGKYRQSKSNLKYKKVNDPEPTHCCLGVLCELYKQETGNGKWLEHKMDTSLGEVVNYTFQVYDETGLHEAIDYPPPPVLKWAGLDQKNPKVLISKIDPLATSHLADISSRLADMNDSGSYGFIAIADIIEDQL